MSSRAFLTHHCSDKAMWATSLRHNTAIFRSLKTQPGVQPLYLFGRKPGGQKSFNRLLHHLPQQQTIEHTTPHHGETRSTAPTSHSSSFSPRARLAQGASRPSPTQTRYLSASAWHNKASPAKPPSMSETVDVLLYGLGAIGSFYAFILSQNPRVRLSVCARSNYEAVKEKGVTIRSENHGGEFNFRPVKVLRSPEEAQHTYDYVVCVHKAVNTDAVLKQLAPVVNDNTTIALMQNGVGIEDPFRKAFPKCTIVSGVIWVGATQPSPGVIIHSSAEDTELGIFPNSAIDSKLEQQRLDGLVALLRDGGTNVQVPPHIQAARWKKVIWNMAWNTLMTLTGVDTKSWLTSSNLSEPVTHRLMTEAITVARALGVPDIEYELADELIARVKTLGRIYSSMYYDSRAARPMEIEVIVGTPVRRGRELGLNIPTLEVIYAMLLAMEQRLAKEGTFK